MELEATNDDNQKEENDDLGKVDEAESENLRQKHFMRRTLLLGIAYSANTGGTGVVTGTSPNLVLMAILQE